MRVSKSRVSRGASVAARRVFRLREPFDFSTYTPRLAGAVRPLAGALVRSTFLSEIQDERLWHPEAPYDMISRTVRGTPARIEVAPRPLQGRFGIPWRVRWSSGDARAIVCVRRQRRKEVIHARGVAGRKGVRKVAKPKRTWRSNLHCR